MKKALIWFYLIALVLLFSALPFLGGAQEIVRVGGGSFASLSALRGSTGINGVVVTVIGNASMSDGMGGQFMYNTASTANDDSLTVFKPTRINGAGRWVKLNNSNSVKGSYVGTAALLKARFTVTHGLGFTPVAVFVAPTSPAACLGWWVDKTTITATTFDVIFATAPVLGLVNNVTFDWIAIKK